MVEIDWSVAALILLANAAIMTLTLDAALETAEAVELATLFIAVLVDAIAELAEVAIELAAELAVDATRLI